MSDRILAVLLATVIPGLSLAQGPQDYRCSYGDLQRRVVILYETGVTVPCEVHYYKDMEAPGAPQVLWRAMNESGYCERKTEEFIAGLQASGWDCSLYDEPGQEPANEPPTPIEPSEADDTEALAPSNAVEPREE